VSTHHTTLIGETFGRLLVIKFHDRVPTGRAGKTQSRWVCQCACPDQKTVIVRHKRLRAGNTRSCGCLRREATRSRRIIYPDIWLRRAIEQVRRTKPLPIRPEILTLPAKECKICLTSFFPRQEQQKTCGYYCRRLLKKRRPLPRTVFQPPDVKKERVNPLQILERDNWTCQLCSFPAPKHLRGSHSSIAPEVGHIIPHAQGGSYTLENLQCEHRGCNLEKNFKNV
jgi:hypothetical protein